MMRSRDPSHFERIYRANPDPWEYRSSDYEQAKYRTTIAALHERRFRSGLEVGCSIGVLTRMLADRCDALLAVDMVEEPLAVARTTCADRPAVCFQRMRVPREWPAGTFDLIVLSEVLYLLTPADIAVLAHQARTSLSADGVVVVVNWRGRSDDPCTGEEAAQLFIQSTRSWLRQRACHLDDGFRLDLLVHR